MNSKNIFTKLFLIAFSIITQASFAQKMYVNMNAGYNFNSAPFTRQNITSIGSNGNLTTTHETVDISLGKGVNIDATFGYMFNKNVGTELGFSYLKGSNSSTLENSNNFSDTRNISIAASMIRFIPTILIVTEYKKIYPYAKLGLIVGSGSYTVIDDAKGSSPYYTSTKYDGGFAFGYFSGFGANYKLNNKISLFGEISIISMSYAPNKSEITESKMNGVNILPNMTIRDKQTEYSDNYTEDNNSSSNTSVPRKSLKQSIPFSSIGFNIGIRYYLK